MALKLRLLGGFEATLNGEPITRFYSEKVRALLIYLAVEAERPHRRSTLAGMLWPDTTESKARQSLRQALRQLRLVLGDREAPTPFLEITTTDVQFNRTSDFRSDLTILEETLTTLSADGTDRTYIQDDQIQQQLLNVSGPLVDGFQLADSDLYNEWLYFKREEIQQKIVAAFRLVVEDATARSAFGDVRTFLQKWLLLEPWHEEVHRRLIEVFIAVGDQSSALAQYERCRQLLANELGVEPAAETEAIIATLTETRQTERITADNGSSSTTEATASIAVPPFLLNAETPSSLAAQQPKTIHRFVARTAELATLHEHLTAAISGRGTICLIAGGAGRGKSALLDEFVWQAHKRHGNLVTAQGNCSAHLGMGDPLLPFREIIALLSGDIEARWSAGALLHEHALRLWQLFPSCGNALVEHGQVLLDTVVPLKPLLDRAKKAVPPTEPWLQHLQKQAAVPYQKSAPSTQEQSALFDAYTQVLATIAKQQPLLLTVDDMQWSDATSTALLFHLVRRLAHLPILLVIAYRDDEIALGRNGARHPLEPVLNEIRRLVDHNTIDLNHEDDDSGQTFIDAYLDSEPNQLDRAFRRALLHHTKGHPLFTVELLRNLQEIGALYLNPEEEWVAGEAIAWDVLPSRVEAVIEERVARLDESLRNLLAIAAVEGEEFTVQIVAQIEATDERAVMRRFSRELDRQHRLVAEAGIQEIHGQRLYRFRFRHILYQQHLFQSLGEMERSLFHDEIGDTLECFYGEQAEEIAPKLAWHFAEAGDAERAIDYLLLAGDQARRLYAYHDAINYYQRALGFLHERMETDRAARTLMKLGLTYHIAFDFRKARDAYEEGFVLWQRTAENAASNLPVAPHPLHIALPTPVTLDPGRYTDDASADVIYQLFSGLVQLSNDMSVMPDIAERWELFDHGRRYHFHLRNDVRWSDGVPVTAHDFVYAWRRLLAPGQPEQLGNYLYDLRNARAYHEGDEPDPNAVGVLALDDSTLEVVLEAPTSYLPQLLTAACTFPVPRHMVERYREKWVAPENIVTNGPFRLGAWQPGVAAQLTRNHNYHGQFIGNIETIALTFATEEPTALLQQYQADHLDTVDLNGLTVVEQDRARQQFAGEYVSGPLLSTTYLGFDLRRPPFNDLRVRRAFAHAIDQEALTDVVLRGISFPAIGGFVPPGSPGHSPAIGIPHDATAAQQLLRKSTFFNGQNFADQRFDGQRSATIEALVTDIPSLVQIAETLWSQWFNVLGIDIVWTPLPWEHFRRRVMEEPPHLWIMGWSADYPDPDNFLRLSRWHVESGWEHFGFEQLVDAARTVTDQEERMALYRRADKILVEDVPIVPLLYKRFHRLVKPWVTSFPTSPVNRDFWRDVVIESH